jgi:fumarylacetoacetase
LPYLQYEGMKNYNIDLQVAIAPEGKQPTTICNSNFRYMYWNQSQQLAHHTINGCNVRGGDVMASGTISGKEPGSYGSMLELSWQGTKTIALADGDERKFLQDGDTVIVTGQASNGQTRIGFGEAKAKILPALS